MKKFTYLLSFLFAACFMACGGDNVVEPTKTPEVPVVKYTIDEASIICHPTFFVSTRYINFTSDCPLGTKHIITYIRQDNLSETTELAKYNTSGRKYYAEMQYLQPGKFIYRIVAYDQDSVELTRTHDFEFEIPKATGPSAPKVEDVKVHEPTSKGGNDAYIEGTVIKMTQEYSTDGGNSWTPVSQTGYIRRLKAGELLLREAETDNVYAGKSASITIPDYSGNMDKDGKGGTSDGLMRRYKF